ncbi:MAG: MMPL family transporter, partial [Bacteroidales bacterium]|nr:MMPL family transporter [Bacteroidales bacterium]
MKRIARILIRYRHILLILMIALGVAGICMLPQVKIVSDMTTYLPGDSRMKHGLDSLKSSFNGIDINGAGVSAMFTNEAVHDALAMELTELDGIAAIIGNRSNDRYTLYQFALDPSASPNEVAESISCRYGDSVTVETASANLLPDNMAFIAIVCVGLLTLILIIMCASVIEAVLFLVAIGIAVAINMGSNVFLPGVSVVTSAIAAILQLILSMDYSIILANRYRKVRERNQDKADAMTQALSDTTPPILSSAMTTILGMSMLAFMDFKIGLDMGLVLSKGVFFSLVSIYFVLPSLILSFDKLIRKTTKKVPLLHTYKLSGFEVRHRMLIAVAFAIFFVASYFLSKRTEISFSNTWPTEVTREFPPQNQTVLLYRT